MKVTHHKKFKNDRIDLKLSGIRQSKTVKLHGLVRANCK